MNLYEIAAKYVTLAYRENIDLGTTEYFPGMVTYFGKPLQILAIPGTNEAKDWLKNIDMLSWEGIKLSSYIEASEIRKNHCPDPNIPLLVCGHSKGGAAAIAYKRLFGAVHCVAFCPARSLRYWQDRKMLNTTIFIDPNDPVPKLGFLSFGHPVCDTVLLPNDFPGIKISDHFMQHITDYLISKHLRGYRLSG